MRSIEKNKDNVRYINPGEKQCFRLELEILGNRMKIDKIKNEMS